MSLLNLYTLLLFLLQRKIKCHAWNRNNIIEMNHLSDVIILCLICVFRYIVTGQHGAFHFVWTFLFWEYLINSCCLVEFLSYHLTTYIWSSLSALCFHLQMKNICAICYIFIPICGQKNEYVNGKRHSLCQLKSLIQKLHLKQKGFRFTWHVTGTLHREDPITVR